MMYWITVICTLVGLYFSARKWTACWPLWVVGNSVAIAYWWPRQEWAAVFLAVALNIMNVYGWWQWHRAEEDEEEEEIPEPQRFVAAASYRGCQRVYLREGGYRDFHGRHCQQGGECTIESMSTTPTTL